MIENINLENIARDIISKFKKYYLNKNGLVSITYPPSEKTIFNHFDDIVPFFIYFDEKNFLIDQVLKVKEKLSFNKILANQNLIYSYRIDEFLGGLFCLWENSQNLDIKQFLDFSLEKIKKNFIYKNNLYGTYDIYTRKRSKFYYFWSSGLLETFLEMSKYYLDLQKTVIYIVDHWLNNNFFLKYHLFPYRWSDNPLIYFFNQISSKLNRYCKSRPIGKKNSIKSRLNIIKNNIFFNYFRSGLYVQFMKSNTTFIFTLIELYKRTKNKKYKSAVKIWIKSVINRMYNDGLVYGFFYPNDNKKVLGLGSNFIFIDVLMDTYHFIETNDYYLNIAKKIIDTQLSTKWKNGLIPMYSKANITHLDTLVDFSISIRRYAELSGNTSYLEHIYKLMNKTLESHSGEYGYYTNIDINGNPKNNLIEPKYNGLLLKGIINLITIDEKIYDNPKLHDIFKDR